MKLLLKFLFLTCLSFTVEATNTTQLSADKIIKKLYHTSEYNSMTEMAVRLEKFSAIFLGKSYLKYALGEGSFARYDQFPLYRLDSFDCETFVDTVLALALANNLPTFKQCIRKIRYQDGKVSFLNRNHFISLDWNSNNQQQGFIKDITLTFKDNSGQSIAREAVALIDKPAWYNHFNLERIKLLQANQQEQEKRLQELKSRGQHLAKTEARIFYLPLAVLFNEDETANMHLFNQIPNAAIIEIVRPNWDLIKIIGTHLNVSHLGFAFRKNGELMFRQASSIEQRVIDVPLISYLKEALKSPTIKGINIQIVVPKNSLTNDCSFK